MDYNRLSSELNKKILEAHRGWQKLAIWDRDDAVGSPSLVHLAYSAILAAIREEPVQWVNVDTNGETDRAATSFTITVWTHDLVVQAVRDPEEHRPTVTVSPRSELRDLKILGTPMLTTADWTHHDNSAELRLTYRAFTANLRASNGDELVAALPHFIRDLRQ